MNILAVDDEKIALEGLISSIQKAMPEAEVAGFRRGDLAMEYVAKTPIDVAFLDIEMRGENGLELARKLKDMYPSINIIFTTGYGDYAKEAFGMHASGYVMKPVTPEKIEQELKELRHPVETSQNRVSCRTFGNFEVFIDKKPVKFQYNKSREFFAFMVDRNGALSNIQEVIAALWSEDDDEGSHISYLKKMRGDIISTFEEAGCDDVIVRQRGRMGILPEVIDCDYFDFLKGDEAARQSYAGEYMVQYSWAEFTNGALMKAMDF